MGRVGGKTMKRVLIIAAIALAGCASPTGPGGQAPRSGDAAQVRPSRVTIAIGAEIDTLVTKFEGGNTFASEFHFMTNSPLAIRNEQGTARPLLAAELPSQDASTWIARPDGTMQTTWKIRPNAVWHDGPPITSTDFVFALRVYQDERLPARDREPEQWIDRIEPVDDKSFVIHWKKHYPWANALVSRQLEALPEHRMGSVYESVDPEAFFNHGFWTSTDYIGTGPYRLTRWDPGSQLIYRAFDQYFMGKPSIDEVIFRIISDTSTVVANVLGGTVDATVGITLGQQGGVTVKNMWSQSGEGSVFVTPVRFRYIQIQLDPERTAQAALLDGRVRRAIAYGMDRAAIAEIVTQGFSPMTEVPVSPNDPIFGRVDAAIVKHPYDPSRAAALLQEAGWSRAGEALVDARGQPFALDVRTTASSDNETEMGIIAADLSKLGMQITQTVIPQSRIRDNEYRVTFPGINTTAQSIDIPGILAVAISDQCATAARRFAGSNRGCWRNADFDRFYQVASTSLDVGERDTAVVQALRVLTEDVGIIGLSYNTENVATRKGLVGPGPRWSAQVGNTWNVHEWRWE
jgi:peptide/nickel transport system substrate-binding protein